MTTYQLDTNVLLRFLTRNIPSEAALTVKLFKKAETGKVALEVSEPVFIETAVALRNYFKFPKTKVIPMLEKILSLSWLTVENDRYLRPALTLYTRHGLDLTDCLVLVRAAAKSQQVFTFDRKLKAVATI